MRGLEDFRATPLGKFHCNLTLPRVASRPGPSKSSRILAYEPMWPQLGHLGRHLGALVRHLDQRLPKTAPKHPRDCFQDLPIEPQTPKKKRDGELFVFTLRPFSQ